MIDEEMHCWVQKHDSHGIYYDNPIWMPKGETPDSHFDWVRLPYLDHGKIKDGSPDACASCDDLREALKAAENRAIPYTRFSGEL